MRKYNTTIKKFVVLLLLCFLSACALPFVFTAHFANADTTSRRVVGYLPDWSYGAYKDLDFSTLTHINIAFCNLNSQGEVYCGIPDNDLNDLVQKAHDNNVKIIAAFGGGGQSDP